MRLFSWQYPCGAYNLCARSGSSESCRESDACCKVPPPDEFEELRCANRRGARALVDRAIDMRKREPKRSGELAGALLAQAGATGHEECRGFTEIPEGLLARLKDIAEAPREAPGHQCIPGDVGSAKEAP